VCGHGEPLRDRRPTRRRRIACARSDGLCHDRHREPGRGRAPRRHQRDADTDLPEQLGSTPRIHAGRAASSCRRCARRDAGGLARHLLRRGASGVRRDAAAHGAEAGRIRRAATSTGIGRVEYRAETNQRLSSRTDADVFRGLRDGPFRASICRGVGVDGQDRCDYVAGPHAAGSGGVLGQPDGRRARCAGRADPVGWRMARPPDRESTETSSPTQAYRPLCGDGSISLRRR
jgi:hypothetical protein